MAEKKSLLVNIAIFPKIMTIAVGKPIQAEGLDENDDILKSIPDPDIVADLPRSANVLYLQRILSKHDSIECKLLEQYVYPGVLCQLSQPVPEDGSGLDSRFHCHWKSGCHNLL